MAKVAVIGVGEMGRRHVRVLAAHGGFEVVGIVDANLARAREVASAYGVPCLRDEGEALARAELVVVATPIGAHEETVARALDAGRDVLVEKPICAHFGDAERLVAAARARGARLFVGHSERFNPVVRALAARVRPDEVRSLDFWREGPPLSTRRRAHDGGVLLNLGVHDIDLAAFLGGSPTQLRRAEGSETRAIITLSTANGAIARVRVDRGAAVRRRAITLTTDAAVYEGDLLAPRLVRTPRNGGGGSVGGASGASTPCLVPLDDAEPLAEQAAALYRALAGECGALATGGSGAHALAIAERAAWAAFGHVAEELAVAEKL